MRLIINHMNAMLCRDELESSLFENSKPRYCTSTYSRKFSRTNMTYTLGISLCQSFDGKNYRLTPRTPLRSKIREDNRRCSNVHSKLLLRNSVFPLLIERVHLLLAIAVRVQFTPNESHYEVVFVEHSAFSPSTLDVEIVGVE